MEYKGIEYKKFFGNLSETIVSALAKGKFPIDDEEAWEKFKENDRILAVIEFPCVDIELEMWTAGGYYFDEATADDDEISLAYVVCKKFGDGAYDWDTDDFVQKHITVDFSSPTWEDELEQDMLETLDKYVEEHGYSYTEVNR